MSKFTDLFNAAEDINDTRLGVDSAWRDAFLNPVSEIDYTLLTVVPDYYISLSGEFGGFFADVINTEEPFGALSPTQQEAVRFILGDSDTDQFGVSSAYRSLYSDVLNFDFKELPQGMTGDSPVGDIAFLAGNFKDGIEFSNGAAEFPAIISGNENGDIFIQNNAPNDFTDDSNVVAGDSGFFVLAHELGHAFGGFVDVDEISDFAYKSPKYSIMSRDFDNFSFQSEFIGATNLPQNEVDDLTPLPYTLQVLDVLALQEKYGTRNFNKRGEDETEYSLGKGFLADPDVPFIYNIWDGGGDGDVINAQGYNVSVQIDLRQGAFSSIGKKLDGQQIAFDDAPIISINEPDPGNVSISYYTVIENATGTSADDILIGNAWNNVLNGGAGNDKIYGDGFVYDGNVGFTENDPLRDDADEVLAAEDGSGNDTLTGGAGDDELYGGVGSDTFVWSRGDGNDTIMDYNADEIDRILFDDPTITYNDLTIERDWLNPDFSLRTDLVISVNGEDGGTIRVKGFFADVLFNSAFAQGLYLSFADGSGTVSTTFMLDNVTGAVERVIDQTQTGSVETDTITIDIGSDVGIFAGAGDDTISGGDGDDYINAGSGNDTIIGLSGADYIDGGDGIDTLDLSGYADASITFNELTNLIITPDGEIPIVPNLNGVERIVLGAGDDNVTLRRPDYIIEAGEGDDTFENDIVDNFDVEVDGDIIARNDIEIVNVENVDVIADNAVFYISSLGKTYENNTFNGLELNYKDIGESLIFNRTQSLDTYQTEVSYAGQEGASIDLINGQDNIKQIIVGSDEGDIYNHNGTSLFGREDFWSGTGDDIVSYNAASQTGTFNVVYTGGDDVINVSSGSMGLFFAPNISSELVFIEQLDTDHSLVTVNGFGSVEVNGQVNIFTPDGSGQDVGTPTDDVITAMNVGGSSIFGNDTLNAGSGNDIITAGISSVYLDVDGGSGDDIVYGSFLSNDLYGGSGNDQIFGYSGNDLLYGGSGNDLLDGGANNDTLIGGAGDDTYVFAAGGGDDVIIDYQGENTLRVIGVDTPESFVYNRIGDDLQIEIASGVTIKGYFSNENTIKFIETEAGEVFDLSEIVFGGAPENTAPDAVADTFDAMDADSVSGNVLQNDTDADGDALTVQANTFVTANGGTVDLLANGDFTYTATDGYRGADSFSYSVDDGRGGTDTAEVTIANIFTNADPDAVNDAFDVNDEAVFAGNVLQNDVDADGDALTVTPAVIATVNGGMVELLADGSFTYTAAEGFSGADTFDYTITDEFGAVDTATVTLSNISAVVEVDIAPEITPETVMVSADIEAVVDPYDFVPEPQAFPELVERARLDSDLVNGANRQNLTFNDDRNVKINFVEEGAGYKNTLGMYTVEADGTLSNVQILDENLSGTGQGVYGGGSFNAGDMLADLDVAAGTEIGFFIVANGYMKNNQYNKTDFDNGTLEFRVQNKNGDTASIDDGKTVLYFTDENGKDIKINGDIWHASSTSLNKDGEVHSVTGDLEDGKLIIGFEDLKNLGDADFNDVVIELEVSPTIDFMLDDVAIATDIVISDDDDMTLTEVTIELKAGEEMGDLLTIDESLLANTNISFSQVTDTSIVLTGAEDVGAYQDIIQSLTFNNVMENPISGLRQIDITVTDADGLSDSTMISVDIGLDADQNLMAIDPADVITEYDMDPLANLLELNTPDPEPCMAKHDTAYIETRVEMVEDLMPQAVGEFG